MRPLTSVTAHGNIPFMNSWQAYEKAGFAGLVAFLFGVMIFNQFHLYGNLVDQRELDVAGFHDEFKSFRDSSEASQRSLREWADQREDRARDREDKQRDKFWAFAQMIKDWLTRLDLRLACVEIAPLPKKSE